MSGSHPHRHQDVEGAAVGNVLDHGRRGRIGEREVIPDFGETFDGHTGGFIIRTMAETASEREMEADIEYLTKLWGDLTVRSREAPPAARLPPRDRARSRCGRRA